MDARVVLEDSPPSPVEELVEARFAFTDPRGRVTRWGEGADELFGIPAEQIVGQPLFEVAFVGADGGWQTFLTDEEEAQCPSSRLEVTVNRSDGQVFPCVVHLVPVLLADGLDFSQFAADLGLDHGDSLDAFKERHQRVLGVIESAAREGAQYAEGERLAGLIATFRPAGDAPITTGQRIDEALNRAERAEREVEDLRDPLARVAAEFAEVRAGLEGVRERIEALEVRAAGESDLQASVTALETSLGERLQALEARPAIDFEPDAFATEIERKLSDRLERALAHRIDEALPPKVEQALNGRLEEALPDRFDQAVSGHLEETLDRHVEEALACRLEQALSGQVERSLPGHVERALSGRKMEHPMRADLEETVSRRIEEAVAARVERAVAGRLEEALAEARKAREEAEQVARELRVGRSTKRKPLPVGFYASDGPSEPDRPSLPDFDEVSTPLATLSLDGRFMHLNGAFRKLVGYSEEEFASARWPSPAFTEHIGSQRELRRALAAGEVEEAPIETAYMHREGLLVPLVGRMVLVRDEEGAPDHLLFSVGAP